MKHLITEAEEGEGTGYLDRKKRLWNIFGDFWTLKRLKESFYIIDIIRGGQPIVRTL